MIINVKVYRNSGEEIGNEIKLDNLIIIDDLFDTVKDKIFYNQNNEERDGFLYKNLLKYELQVNDTLIHLDTNKQLLFYINDYTKKRISIQVTSIVDILDSEFYTIYLLGENSSQFTELFEKYKHDFIDLTKHDLWYCIIARVLLDSNLTLSKNDTIESLNDAFEEFTNYMNNEFDKIESSYKRQSRDLNKYYTIVEYSTIPLNFNVKYNNVEIEYRPIDFIAGTRGKFINLLVLFNRLELDINFPYVMLSKSLNTSENENPISRIYNNTIASETQIKSWSLTEKIKDSVYVYKRLSGILIKLKIKNNNNYMSIIINESGIIKVNWEDIYKNIEIQLDYDNILNYIKESIELFINKISLIKGVFKKPINFNAYQKKIKSIDSLISIDTFIDRFDFSKLLNNNSIITYLFSQKDTLTIDTLFLYYLKLGTVENRISLSIKDNLYEKGSIIQIYNIQNTIQIEIIITQLLSIYYTLPVLNTNQVLIEKGRIKDLRAAGVEISSMKCQSGQQPLINTEGDNAFDIIKKKIPDVYQVEYKNIKYTCPTELYPYVGINTNNGICCFKRDQRSKTEYIRTLHPDLINVDVQPSNFKITVSEDNNSFITFVIKVVYSLENDYVYHFINSKNDIIPILNEDLVKEIETNEENAPLSTTMWLETVPIYYLTTNPAKNKCVADANVYNKDNHNINKPCEHLKNTPYFGYSSNSYPCCFVSPPAIYNGIDKRKKKDAFSKDIIIGEKILDNDRFGKLHPNLRVLFNKYLKFDTGIFYRYGINQGKYAILNAIIKSGLTKDNSPFDLLTSISDYLSANPDIITGLNDGYIVDKFTNNNTLQRYITFLKTNEIMNPLDILDVLQRMFDVNIHIFEIPLKISEYKKEFEYDNIRLFCKTNIKSNYTKNIILIKRSHYYELIAHARIDTINFIFNNDAKCIQFLNNFTEKTCKQIPEKYVLYTYQEVTELIIDKPWKIMAQIINNRKTEMLLIKHTKKKFFILLPIFQKGAGIQADVKNYSLKSISESIIIMTLADTIPLLPDIQAVFPSYNIIGYIVNDYGFVDSAITSYGINIPLKYSKLDTELDIPRMNYTYMIQDESIDLGHDSLDTFIKNETENDKKVYEFKVLLGGLFEKFPEVKNKILNIILDTTESRIKKFFNIKKAILRFINVVVDDILLSNVTNEILNDNIENNLLNNVIVMTRIDTSKITIRESESILLNMDDILKWVHNFKT
jgi:hypothetical protein